MSKSPLALEMFLRNISQSSIANKAGIHRSNICRVVSGKRKASEKIIEAFKSFGLEINKDGQDDV